MIAKLKGGEGKRKKSVSSFEVEVKEKKEGEGLSRWMHNGRFNFFQSESNDYRESVDRVEVIKLPAHSTNGSVLPAPSSYTSSTTTNTSNSNDSDAPLNLSLKPATTSSNSPISGSQPLSQLSNLSQSLLASDRTCE